ncbi:DUF4232 domain-containing protein [Streptomyces sp. NBC_01795]|uniref:DUF4232 domain-containing protein n=1 Tax=Streptomyces sp. NBC_01795 TaxID=2975943 RepID=UPI002DDB0B49|nr:DUF4232 domain-containing protein [Streptomyces sp. NBC_01795]WSA97493.1 DUF4232 domain-containing protein [Streptomyces sp. NBC_01795]
MAAALAVTGCTSQSSGPSKVSSSSGGPAPGDSRTPPHSAPPRSPSTSAATSGKTPGGGSASGAGRTPSSRPPGQGAGFPHCSPGTLSASLRQLEAAAGNRYAALVLTNTSDRPCRTQGWPGLQLTSEGGGRIPTETARDRAHEAQPITLKPDDRAWSRLHWTVVSSSGDAADGSCPTPGALRIIPPDERHSLGTGWDLGTVCGKGRIQATALSTGEGPAH